MDLPAVLKLAGPLAEAVLAKDDHASRILAADLKAAFDAPQTFKRWTPHSTGNAS